MGNHDDGRSAFVDLLQQFNDLLGVTRVQVAGRLISYQQFRLIGNGPADNDTLLLTTGQLGWIVIEFGGKVDDVENFTDPFIDFFLAFIDYFQRKGDIVKDGFGL